MLNGKGVMSERTFRVGEVVAEEFVVQGHGHTRGR